MLHRLERADELPELLPRLDVLDAGLEHPVHTTDEIGTGGHSADRHRSGQCVSGTIAPGQHRASVDRDVLEVDLAEPAREIDARRRGDGHAVRLGGDDTEHEITVQTTCHDEMICRACVHDTRLASVHPEVIIPGDGLLRDVRQIPAGVGLQECHGGTCTARCELSEKLDRLRVVARFRDERRGPERGEKRARRARPADLLEDHRQLHQAEPEPSVGLGQRHARPALIRGCLPEGFVDRRLGLHQLSHTGHLTVAGEESTR